MCSSDRFHFQSMSPELYRYYLSVNFELEDGFMPYAAYMRNYRSINRFTQLTAVSYGLTWDMLKQNPETSLPPVEFDKNPSLKMSYGLADRSVESVTRKYGWVSLVEYSEKENLPVEAVISLAESGDLGRIELHPDTGEKIVIWPSQYKNDPEVGKLDIGGSVFEAKVVMPISLTQVMPEGAADLQMNLLQAAHIIGAGGESQSDATRVLFQSGILLQWTAFEVFLRDTVAHVFRQFPNKLGKMKRELGYDDLVKLSNGFSSINSVMDALIEREIDALRSGGLSANGLINYLKKEFHFDRDPYKVTYVFQGEEVAASFGDLNKVREARNALIHEGAAESWESDDLEFRVAYEKSRLLMSSIAYNLSNSLFRKRYAAE